MSARFTRPKRVIRILLSSWPVATKRALLRAERRGGADVEVPVGDRTAWIDGASDEIDYFTLYGAIVDRHFPCDVAGAAVLDVGAHKGYFALRSFADGAARVDSYEPASQNLSSLRRSAVDALDWTVHPAAVGAEAGTVELHLAPGSWGHSVHTPVGGTSVGTETVEMVALSDALASIGGRGLPVVAKINVEGAAGSMILGTRADDWSAVRLLWADVEVNDPVGLDQIVAHLAPAGLRHERSDGQRNLFVRD
ncbi:MAG: FkbM family methyltransferase [Actinomycetota bacterium]